MFAKFKPVNTTKGYDVRWIWKNKNKIVVCDFVKESQLRDIKINDLKVFTPRNKTTANEYKEQFIGIDISTEKYCFIRKEEIHKRKWNNYHHEYLSSDYWNAQRRYIFNKYDGRCVFCNSQDNLQVHHRTYSKRGEKNEERKDLFLFCKECHHSLHKIRPIDGKIRI